MFAALAATAPRAAQSGLLPALGAAVRHMSSAGGDLKSVLAAAIPAEQVRAQRSQPQPPGVGRPEALRRR